MTLTCNCGRPWKGALHHLITAGHMARTKQLQDYIAELKVGEEMYVGTTKIKRTK